MQTEQLILLETFCIEYPVEFSFIQLLIEHGLVQISTVEEQTYIPESELPQIEKIIRLHNDLEINLEGVEVINYLLAKLQQQQDEINALQNKLRFFES
jgi:hypothetical protein